MLTGTERVETKGQVHNDIVEFIDRMQYEDIDMRSLGITMITKAEALDILKRIYE